MTIEEFRVTVMKGSLARAVEAVLLREPSSVASVCSMLIGAAVGISRAHGYSREETLAFLDEARESLRRGGLDLD